MVTTTKSSKAKGGLENRLREQQAGFDKHVQGKNTLRVSGTDCTSTAADAKYEGFLKPYDDRTSARTATKTAHDEVKAQEAEAKAWADAVELAVKSEYGLGDPILLDFGINPPKARVPLTPEQLLQRKARNNETRTLRGTTSKKAKAALKATTSYTVTTAPTAAPPSSASAAPVPVAAPGAVNAAAPAAAAPVAPVNGGAKVGGQ